MSTMRPWSCKGAKSAFMHFIKTCRDKAKLKRNMLPKWTWETSSILAESQCECIQLLHLLLQTNPIQKSMRTKLWIIFHCFQKKCMQWPHFLKSTNTFVIHTPQLAKHYAFSEHFSKANKLLSKLIKAHSNQNEGKCPFLQELYWNIND